MELRPLLAWVEAWRSSGSELSRLSPMWPRARLSCSLSLCTQWRMPADSSGWVRVPVMKWSAPTPQGAKDS